MAAKLLNILCFASLALLAGCAQKVQTEVTVFHALPNDLAGKTIALIPGDPAKTSQLEWATYAAELGQHLTTVGMVPAAFQGAKEPDYVGVFVYGIDDGRLVSSTYVIPNFGVTGYSGSTTTGTVSTFGNVSTLNATTTNDPEYGITGYSTGAETGTVYKRAIIFRIFDTSKVREGDPASVKSAMVYDASLKSEGSCGAMATVMQPMLDAMFKDFPGKSGTANKVAIALKDHKC